MTARILFKVEKERALVPVGEPYPFGCKYCYTRGGEVGLSKINAENILLQLLWLWLAKNDQERCLP